MKPEDLIGMRVTHIDINPNKEESRITVFEDTLTFNEHRIVLKGKVFPTLKTPDIEVSSTKDLDIWFKDSREIVNIKVVELPDNAISLFIEVE